MKTVKIKVLDLLETVRENRIKHETEYKEALAIWRADCISKMKQNLEDAENNREVVTYIELQKPVDYIKDYDRLISMLEWTEDESVELGAHEFDQYVNDNWNWKEDFSILNSAYLSKKA
jgi:hypothetical protein